MRSYKPLLIGFNKLLASDPGMHKLAPVGSMRPLSSDRTNLTTSHDVAFLLLPPKESAKVRERKRLYVATKNYSPTLLT